MKCILGFYAFPHKVKRQLTPRKKKCLQHTGHQISYSNGLEKQTLCTQNWAEEMSKQDQVMEYKCSMDMVKSYHHEENAK
jgi:hypothetical protein